MSALRLFVGGDPTKAAARFGSFSMLRALPRKDCVALELGSPGSGRSLGPLRQSTRGRLVVMSGPARPPSDTFRPYVEPPCRLSTIAELAERRWSRSSPTRSCHPNIVFPHGRRSFGHAMPAHLPFRTPRGGYLVGMKWTPVPATGAGPACAPCPRSPADPQPVCRRDPDAGRSPPRETWLFGCNRAVRLEIDGRPPVVVLTCVFTGKALLRLSSIASGASSRSSTATSPVRGAR